MTIPVLVLQQHLYGPLASWAAASCSTLILADSRYAWVMKFSVDFSMDEDAIIMITE